MKDPREHHRRYYLRHRDYILKRNAAYYQLHKEQHRKAALAYYHRNKSPKSVAP